MNASEISGKNVPHRITKQRPTSARLLSRNAASRDSSESSLCSDASCGARVITSTAEPITITAISTRNGMPRVDAPNAWIELRMPERTRNVPSTARMPAASTSDTFHIFSMPRFSCTIAECRNAVPISHGISDAFSTASHPQYPPQPSSE